jgi:hypothetical protein
MTTLAGGDAAITRIGSLPPNASARRTMLSQSIQGDGWGAYTMLGRRLAQELRIA